MVHDFFMYHIHFSRSSSPFMNNRATPEWISCSFVDRCQSAGSPSRIRYSLHATRAIPRTRTRLHIPKKKIPNFRSPRKWWISPLLTQSFHVVHKIRALIIVLLHLITPNISLHNNFFFHNHKIIYFFQNLWYLNILHWQKNLRFYIL